MSGNVDWPEGFESSTCESPRSEASRNVEVGGRGGWVEAAYDPPEGGKRDAVRTYRSDVERALGPSLGHCKVSLSSHTLRTLQSAKSIPNNAVIWGERCRPLEIGASGRGRL